MRARTILVGLLLVLALACAVGNACMVYGTSYAASSPGWLGEMRDGRFVVTHVTAGGLADVLREGDEIVAFNGRKIESPSETSKFFRLAEPGTPYTITVGRDGGQRELQLRTIPVSTESRLLLLMQTLVIPAVFLFIGFGVFLLKPYDKQALLLAAQFATVAVATKGVYFAPEWLKLVLAAGFVAKSFSTPLVFHLLLVFPERSPLLGRFPRLEYLLYLPQLMVLPAHLWVAIQLMKGQEVSLDFLFQPFSVANGILLLLYLTGGVLSLVFNYRQAGRASRRKVRVVVAATLLTALPLTMLQAVVLYTGATAIEGAVLWLGLASLFALPLVPLAFAYAILRHQVIPVSLILRRSVQYLLAKNALRILVALPLVGLGYAVFSNRQRPLDEILFRNSIYFYLLLTVALAVGLFFRRRLSEWMDRRFFRESYNQERVLRELIDNVKSLDSIPEMSRSVTEQVDKALHPEHIYLFYRKEKTRALSLSYSSGGISAETKIPEDFQLLRFMELQGGALAFPFPHKNNLPAGEKEWLAQLGTRLIVPMTGTDNRLAGLFLLGQKKAEVPYTARDRELLETLADQIAIVYENVQLKERVDHERKVKREVLARFEDRDINLLKECPQCGACFDSAVQFCPQDRSELTLSLPVERDVDGRYRLDRLLGRGGMGAVYEATDLRLNRRVAVKILTGQLFGNSKALRRFEREAQTSARLSHPHIITIFDYGLLQTEGAYLVMELLEGCTLGALIKREGRIECRQAARWFDQVLEAVKAAHQAGVIHRDLKPENVFIVRGEQSEEQIKILDFGLAKLQPNSPVERGDQTTPMTTPGMVMGTFGYMSPEQLTGGSVDERSDLFSIGVMVIEALTGRRPFAGKTYTELLNNILRGSYHLPGATPEVRRLDEALQKCLATEGGARFASAAEMQAVLIPAMLVCPPLPTQTAFAADADTFIIPD